MDRTVPYIKLLRDTFRDEAADRGLEAGASCINDVYAITGPREGLARLSYPI
jgi:hypothetical protein